MLGLGVHGPHELEETNEAGQELLSFLDTNEASLGTRPSKNWKEGL